MAAIDVNQPGVSRVAESEKEIEDTIAVSALEGGKRLRGRGP